MPSLLFDVVESKLPVLDLSNAPLMNKIYKDNGSGWIKIGVVRDPVTRLLSAYLDLVQTWQNIENKSPTDIYGQHQPHRGLSIADTLEWFDIIRRHRDLKGDETKQHIESRGKEHIISRSLVKDNDDRGESDEASRRLQEAAGRKIPTFKELLDVLDVHLWKAPLAFRPVSGQCGMGLSSFDTIIPFETLQVCNIVYSTRIRALQLHAREYLRRMLFRKFSLELITAKGVEYPQFFSEEHNYLSSS